MKYRAEITDIGALAEDLLKGGDMIIFEQCEAKALAEMCFMHTKAELIGSITVGDQFIIGEKSYKVAAVGEEAEHTLKTLGHCTLKFTNSAQVELPGQINLKGNGIPKPQIGDMIEID